MIAEFLADAIMMGHIVNQQTLMVMTSDADIPCTSGDGCIAVTDFTKDGNIPFFSMSGKRLQKVIMHLT